MVYITNADNISSLVASEKQLLCTWDFQNTQVV